MYELRKMKKGDLVYENLRDYEKKFADKFGREIQENMLLNCTYPFTLVVDGEIVGSAGFQIYWPGVCEVWMAATKLFEKKWIRAAGIMEAEFQRMIKEQGIWRFQVTIEASLELNQKFVGWLKFKPENLMRKYGPWGEDYIMFSRIVE